MNDKNYNGPNHFLPILHYLPFKIKTLLYSVLKRETYNVQAEQD